MKAFTLSLIASCLLLAGCSSESGNSLLTPNCTGSPYDVYLVMPSELNETPLNDSLHAIFEYPMEGTPSGDEYFYVSTIQPENFVRIIRTLRNIVIIDVDPRNSEKPHMTKEFDTYARGQIIIKMYGNDQQTLADYLMQHQAEIRKTIVDIEIERSVQYLSKNFNSQQKRRLKKLQQVTLDIPETISRTAIGQTDPNFFWATDNITDKQSHIVVYSIPYTDANVFTLEGAIAVRDSVLKANIPGASEGSYMTTYQKYILPTYTPINVNDNYVGELRGLWKMENEWMAGSFVCHIRLDEINNRVIFAEGFCYAPRDSKRKLIRNLEATLHTLKLPADIQAEEAAKAAQQQ